MKPVCCPPRYARRGIGLLIELIIVAVIILGAFSLYASFQGGAGEMNELMDDSSGTTQSVPDAPRSVPGRALRKAHSTECQNNVRQLRMMVSTEQTEDGYPASLLDISGAAAISICPVSKQAYSYDPTTGEVKCTFPGHEAF